MERGDPNSDQAVNALDHQLREVTLCPLWSRKVVSTALTYIALTSVALASAAITWTKFSRAASTALDAPKGKDWQRVREIANGRTTLSPFELYYELL